MFLKQKIKILDDENDGKNAVDSFGDKPNLKGTEDLNNSKLTNSIIILIIIIIITLFKLVSVVPLD